MNMRVGIVAWLVALTLWPTPAHATIYLPRLAGGVATCTPMAGESYGVLIPEPPSTDRPAEVHGDLNLALRGYARTVAYLGLIDIGGVADSRAPLLRTLFGDGQEPAVRASYQVHEWDWVRNERGPLIADPEVTLLGLGTTPGQPLYLPRSGYSIGSGYEALVLYASTERLTIKYTREDNVVEGYTLHVEGICVEPSLLALYRQLDQAGRQQLPALRPGQGLGRARSSEVKVAIRDRGAFMDPRSRKDWWQGH